MPGGSGDAIFTGDLKACFRENNRIWPDNDEERKKLFKAFDIDVSKEPEDYYPLRFGEFISLFAVCKRHPEDEEAEEVLNKYKLWSKVDKDGSGAI